MTSTAKTITSGSSQNDGTKVSVRVKKTFKPGQMASKHRVPHFSDEVSKEISDHFVQAYTSS